MKEQPAVVDLKKKDKDDDATPASEARDEATAAPPRSKSPRASAELKQPAPARVGLVEKPSRLPEINGARVRRSDKPRRDDGKILVVGREIEIAETGTFKGQVEFDRADISGIFEGDLMARDHLVVRATGRITGKVRFGELEIERGGQIIGDVQIFGEDAAAGRVAQNADSKSDK